MVHERIRKVAIAGLARAGCLLAVTTAGTSAMAAELPSPLLPAGASTPAWATPQSDASARSKPLEADTRPASADTRQPSIYDPAPVGTALARGAVVTDTNLIPSGTVVNSGSRLAIIMIGQYQVQVPANAVGGDGGALSVSLSPDDVARMLANSARFQAETAKLIDKR